MSRKPGKRNDSLPQSDSQMPGKLVKAGISESDEEESDKEMAIIDGGADNSPDDNGDHT